MYFALRTKWLLIVGLIGVCLAQNIVLSGSNTQGSGESKQYASLLQIYEEKYQPYGRFVEKTAFQVHQMWMKSASNGTNWQETHETTVRKYFHEQAIIIGYRDITLTYKGLIQRLQLIPEKGLQERQTTFMTRYYELMQKQSYDVFGMSKLMDKLREEDNAEYARWKNAVTKLSALINKQIQRLQEELRKATKNLQNSRGTNFTSDIFSKVDVEKLKLKLANSSERELISEKVKKLKSEETNFTNQVYLMNLEQFWQIFEIMYQKPISLEQYAKTDDWKDAFKQYAALDAQQGIIRRIWALVQQFNNTQTSIIGSLQSISNTWRVSEHTNFTDAYSSSIEEGKKAHSLALTFYAIDHSFLEVSEYWDQTTKIIDAIINEQKLSKATRTPEQVKTDERRQQIFEYRMQKRYQELINQQNQFWNSLNSQMAYQSSQNQKLQNQITENHLRTLKNYEDIQQKSNQKMLQSIQRISDRMSK